jgi:hypothetical protein
MPAYPTAAGPLLAGPHWHIGSCRSLANRCTGQPGSTLQPYTLLMFNNKFLHVLQHLAHPHHAWHMLQCLTIYFKNTLLQYVTWL